MIIPNIIPPYPTDLKKASSPSYPKLVSGLKLWIDASDNLTVLQSTTDNTAYSSNGSVVKKILDKSGGNYHLTTTDAGGNANNLCRYDVGGLNGKNIITFPQGGFAASMLQGDVGIKSNFDFLHLSVSEIFCVYFSNTTTSNASILFSNTTNVLNGLKMMYIGSPVGFQTTVGNSSNYISQKAAFNTASIFGTFALYHIKSDMTAAQNSRMEYFINNVSGGGNDPRFLAPDGSTSHSAVHIGASSRLGDVKYAELVVYNRRLTVAERTGMYTYLKNKWALPY